jgi:hypothetical protein
MDRIRPEKTARQAPAARLEPPKRPFEPPRVSPTTRPPGGK